ncbi:MAG TPA: hypothetical protein VFB96_15300 [Pirellulaceae bacterium]|jgi:hypothetical protein|nr:hypothetical protein [Pirellulaceae bacterium]
MKPLPMRSALAATAMLLVALVASQVHAQGDCPNCVGHHGLLGHHGMLLHGAYGAHPAGYNLQHFHDPYGYYAHGNYGHHDYYGQHGIHGVLGETGANWGDCAYRYYGLHDLFGNYFVGNNCGGFGAAMYVSPLPVPPHVGHTFITYQPLMPHEFMYRHHRTYHRYYNGGMGLTRASVIYR